MSGCSWLVPNNVITPQHNVWIAYSGGVDSHVLLDIARRCFNNVRAIHVNHNLNNIDAQWQRHCESICAKLNIPLHVLTVDARPQPGQSPEEAARIARRAAWHSLLQTNDVLLLAHHADDQAETVLFRLLRGSGPKGLSGIKEISKIGAATIWRPLLNVGKQQLLEYAVANNLHWLEDATNENCQFDRNYLRHQIMPLMQQRWPKAVSNINRAAKLCSQLEELVGPQIKAILDTLSIEPSILDIQKLSNYPADIQKEVIRSWLLQQEIIPSSKHVTVILNEVVNAKSDAMPQYLLGNMLLKRSSGKLYLLPQTPDITYQYESEWDLQQELLLPNGNVLTVLDLPPNSDFISRLAKSVATVRLGNHGAKAKKIFQYHNIPVWERNKYPLIFADNRLVCIVGLWSSPRF